MALTHLEKSWGSDRKEKFKEWLTTILKKEYGSDDAECTEIITILGNNGISSLFSLSSALQQPLSNWQGKTAGAKVSPGFAAHLLGLQEKAKTECAAGLPPGTLTGVPLSGSATSLFSLSPTAADQAKERDRQVKLARRKALSQRFVNEGLGDLLQVMKPELDFLETLDNNIKGEQAMAYVDLDKELRSQLPAQDEGDAADARLLNLQKRLRPPARPALSSARSISEFLLNRMKFALSERVLDKCSETEAWNYIASILVSARKDGWAVAMAADTSIRKSMGLQAEYSDVKFAKLYDTAAVEAAIKEVKSLVPDASAPPKDPPNQQHRNGGGGKGTQGRDGESWNSGLQNNSYKRSAQPLQASFQKQEPFNKRSRQSGTSSFAGKGQQIVSPETRKKLLQVCFEKGLCAQANRCTIRGEQCPRGADCGYGHNCAGCGKPSAECALLTCPHRDSVIQA